MANFWHGGSVSLSASGSGEISLRMAVDGDITQFLVNSTGRAKITNIDVQGYQDVWKGSIEVDQFKQYGNVYDLPEVIPVTSGSTVTISLTDLSGATNVVYFGLHIKKK